MAQPPAAATDARLLCQRIGCSARYTEEANPEGGCRYHPGPPVFHDGGKEWGCCKARSHDFALFMSMPGCAVGRHTQEKPPKPAASPNARGPAPMPLPLGAARAPDAPGRADCLRCRQGFFCADHPAEAAPPPPPKPAVPKPPADPDAVQTCRNKGCGNKFTERENADGACRFHPGPPIFHERQKGWQCCNKVVYDFDEFLSIPPCATGRHCADADGGAAYAKLAK